MNKIDVIKNCVLFSALDSEAISLLGEVAQWKEFEKDSIIFHQYDEAKGFYVIASGIVELFVMASNGREKLMHQLEEGVPVGEAPVFEGGVYPVSAKAKTNLKCLYITRENITKISKSHPEIPLKMLAILSKRLRLFVEMISDLSSKDVYQRLAKYILNHSREDGDNFITLDKSKKDLASYLGTIPETLSRALKKMENEGFIKVEKDIIIILNLHLLHEITLN